MVYQSIEVDFPLFLSMKTRGQCVMREGWDTTPNSDSYIETVQICYSGLDQCWLKLCRTDWALARSLQAAGILSQLITPAQPGSAR